MFWKHKNLNLWVCYLLYFYVKQAHYLLLLKTIFYSYPLTLWLLEWFVLPVSQHIQVVCQILSTELLKKKIFFFKVFCVINVNIYLNNVALKIKAVGFTVFSAVVGLNSSRRLYKSFDHSVIITIWTAPMSWTRCQCDEWSSLVPALCYIKVQNLAII